MWGNAPVSPCLPEGRNKDADTSGKNRRTPQDLKRSPMIWEGPIGRVIGRASVAVGVSLLLASCGTSTETGLYTIINQPDGVTMVWTKYWYKDRLRMPMDHGSDHTLQAQVFQAFHYSADGSDPQPIPVDYSVELKANPTLSADPAIIWRNGALDVRRCTERGRISGGRGLPCSARRSNLIGQFARRSEDALLDGSVLVLPIGPASERNCRINLKPLLKGYSAPAEQTTFRLAHYPGRASYLAKVVGETLPVYRLQCGQLPQLLGDFAIHDAGDWTDIVDIAPGSNPAQPRILLRTQARNQAIVTNPQGEIFSVQADPVGTNDFAFLTADAQEIILKTDYLFRDPSPRLTLELANINTGARRKLDFRHKFAPWPVKP